MNQKLIFALVFLIGTYFPQKSDARSQPKTQHLFEVWEDIPSESYLKIYLFNMTNPDEFELKENTKPILAEVGPYVFLEKVHKINISQSEDRSTASFAEIKTYEFIPEKSTGSENDLVNIFNVPLLTFGKILGNIYMVGPNYFKSLVKSGERLIRRNERVGDVLYYGINAKSYVNVLSQLGEKIPEQFSENRFGLFKGRNGTSVGEFIVETGNTVGSKYGHISSWKGASNLTWWGSEDCNRINGTLGQFVDSAYLAKYHINIFEPDACRNLKYSYHGKSEEKHGIDSFKFVLAKDMLRDPRENEGNLCYCSKVGNVDDGEEKFKYCYKKGIMDLSPCRNGAPLALSLPHFYEADESYGEGVVGMEPEKDKHRSYMIVEPKTGIVLKDVRRFQLNIQLQRILSLPYLKNVTDILLPVFWTERTYTLTDEAIEQVKLEASKLPGIDEHGGYQPEPEVTESSPSSAWSIKSVGNSITCFAIAISCFYLSI